MTSRPQFSLRNLLLVMVLVCLAAATVTELPKEQRLGRHVQTAVSFALCMIVPAILGAGAMNLRGYAQSLCIGGLFPALGPLMMVGTRMYLFSLPPIRLARFVEFWRYLSFDRQMFALAWALVPCVGLLSLFARAMFQIESAPKGETRASVRRFAFRSVMSAILATCVTATIIVAPSETATWSRAQGVALLMLAFLFPALVAVAAIHGQSTSRAFSMGAAPFALLSMEFACNITEDAFSSASLLDKLTTLSRYRFSSAALWAGSFVCGFAFFVVYWLLHRSQLNATRG